MPVLSIYDPSDSDSLTPPDIILFERRWLSALAVSVAIAALMFDISKDLVGVVPAVLINVVLFSIAAGLMVLISRRRSKVARWLLAIPLNLLVLSYDISHLGLMEDTYGSIALYLVPFRLGFMAYATWALFTPSARAWFAGRPDPLV